MEMDKIGLFKGQPISTLDKRQLLEFAEWAGTEIDRLRRKTTINR